MEEDEENDSDTTVLLEDLDENPDKVARKRHKLETKYLRVKRANNNATRHGTDENTAPVYSNNTRIDGLMLENNKRVESWVNTYLTPNKDTDGHNTRNNDNHEDNENVLVHMRDENEVKKELLKQERLNDDLEQTVYDVISISDDDCAVDEIEHQCTSGERVDELNNFIKNQVDENKTNARIRVLKPSVINARRATLDSFEGNVTGLSTSNLESATNEKGIKPRTKDSKLSAINARRATVTCAESNETECCYEIDKFLNNPNVLDKPSAGNVKRPKIVLRLLKNKINEKSSSQNITTRTNEEGSLGDDYRNKNDSTVSSNINHITKKSNSKNVLKKLNLHNMPFTSNSNTADNYIKSNVNGFNSSNVSVNKHAGERNSKHEIKITGNKEVCGSENTAMKTSENAFNNSTAVILERDTSNPNNNENVHTNLRDELDVKKELLKQELDNDDDVISIPNDEGVNEPANFSDDRQKDDLNSSRNIYHERKPLDNALDLQNMPSTSNINTADVLVNCSSVTVGIPMVKSKTMHKMKFKNNINGNKKACVSENLIIDSNENGLNHSTATVSVITLEPEHDKNNANNKSSVTNDSSTTKVLSTNAHETRKAIKRLLKDDNSSTDCKRTRYDSNNIPDRVPCSIVVTNAILNSLEEDGHKTREENGENANMLINEIDKSESNNKYINKGNVHDGTYDGDQADIDEEIERVIKFQFGFCMLIKENLKEKCLNHALEPEKTKEFLKSVNLLENEIEALKTLANADFKFYCPLCTSVTTFAANNNESNSQNHEHRNKRCVLCCGFKSIYKSRMKVYFDIQSSNKDDTLTKQPTQNFNIERAQENTQTVTASHKNDNVAIISVSGNAEVTIDKLRDEDTSVVDMLSISNNDDSRKTVKSDVAKVITTEKRPNGEKHHLNMPATFKNNVDRYNAVGCIPAKDITSSTKDVSVKHLSENTVPSLERSPIVETNNLEILSKSKSNNNKDLNHSGDSILAKTKVLSKMSRDRCRSEEISVKVTDQYSIERKSGAKIPSTSINTGISRPKARNRRHSEEISLGARNKRIFKETFDLNLPSKSKTNDDSSHIIANATNKPNVRTEKAGHKCLSESVTFVSECPFVPTSDLKTPLTYKGNDVPNQGVHSEAKRHELTEKGGNNQSQGVIVKAADKEHILELSATNIPSSFKNTDVSNYRLENDSTKVTVSTVVKLASEERSKLNIPLISKSNDPNRRTDSASTKDNSKVTDSDRRKNEIIPVPSLDKLPLAVSMPSKSNNKGNLNRSDDFHPKTNVVNRRASDRLKSEQVSVTTVNKHPHDETEIYKPSASNKSTNSNRIAGDGIESKAVTTRVVDRHPSKEASYTRIEKRHIIKSTDLNMPSISKNIDVPNHTISKNRPIKALTDHNMPSTLKSNKDINQNHKIDSVISETIHSPKRKLDDDESLTKRFRTDDINAGERNKNENMKTLSNQKTKGSVAVATIATAGRLSIEKHTGIPNFFLVRSNDSKENLEAIHIKNQCLNGTKNEDQEKEKENSSFTKAIGESSKIHQQVFIGSKLSRTISTSNQTENSDLTPPLSSTNLKHTDNGQNSKSKSLNGTCNENGTGGKTINDATNVAKASQKASEASKSLAFNNINVDREKNESGETQRCRASDSDKSDDESEITEDEDDATVDENSDSETNKAKLVLNSLEKLSIRLKTTMNTTKDKLVESVPLDSTVKNKHIKRSYKPETRYVCETCSCIFTYPSRYLDHMKNDHNVNDIKIPENCKILRCRFCYVELNRKSYNLHVKQHHPDKYLEKRKKGNVIINSSKIDTRPDVKDAQGHIPPITKRKYEFKCFICKETLHSFYAARRHRETKHPDLKSKKKLYEKRLINAEIGQNDIANSHKQDKSCEVTDSTPYDEGEHETSDCDEEVRQEHVEDDNDEGTSVSIDENVSDEADQRSKNKDENKSDTQDDKNYKQKISNTKSKSISSDNNIDSDEKDRSGAKSHISEAHSVIETDYNRKNLSTLTDEQESTKESSETDNEETDKNLTESNPTLDYSTETNEKNELFNDENEKTRNYIYKCKLCNEMCNSDYARRMHRKTKHIEMKKKKLFDKILVTDALTCAYDVLDVQIESHDDIGECDEQNKSDKGSRDGVLHLSYTDINDDGNESEEHGNKPNQEIERIHCKEHDAHLIDEHSIDRESEIFQEILRIDANASCDESSIDKNERNEADSDSENDYTARRHRIVFDESLSNENLKEDEEATEKELAPSLGGSLSMPLDNKAVKKGLSGQKQCEVNHSEQNDRIGTENSQTKRRDIDKHGDSDELNNSNHDSNEKLGKDLERRLCILEESTNMNECVSKYKQCQRLQKNKNVSNVKNVLAEPNEHKVDVSVDEVKKSNTSPHIPKISTNGDLIHENNAQNGSKEKEEHITNVGTCNNDTCNKKTGEASFNESCDQSKTNTDGDEDANGSNSNVVNKQMTEYDYVFKCQECEHATKIYDNVIQHCQNHYTLKDIHANSLEHSYTEKNNKVIEYTYESLFKDWDRIFGGIPLYIAKDIKARSIYKTFCVKMSIIESGSWKHSLYQCGLCATCVPPQEIELHCQEKCYFISYPCSLAACNMSFTTNAARDEHEKNHAAAIRLVAFNNKRDKEFNNTLFEVRKKTQQHEQEFIDIQQQHGADTQQQAVDPQQQEVDPQQRDVDLQQQDVDAQQQDIDAQQQDVDAQQQDVDAQQRDVDPQQQDVDPQQQDVDPQQRNVDPEQQDIGPKQQTNDLQQQVIGPQQQDVDPPQQQNIKRTPQANIYKCQCDLSFINSKKFKLHFIDCNLKTNSGVQCQKCAVPRLFETDELEEHMALHHGKIKYEFKVHTHRVTVKLELEENPSEIRTDTEQPSSDLQADSDEVFKKELLKEETINLISDEED